MIQLDAMLRMRRATGRLKCIIVALTVACRSLGTACARRALGLVVLPCVCPPPRGQLTDIMADDYTMKLLDDLHDAEFGVLIMAYLGHGSNRVAYKQTCIGIQAHKSGRHHNTCCQTMKMLDDLRDNEFSALMRQYNWHGSNTMEQGESSL